MDALRDCYSSTVRPYRDRPDVEVQGQWHFCPPGALDLPFIHTFGASVNDFKPYTVEPILGEIPQLHPHRVRDVPIPRATGKRACGTAEDWMGGCPFTPPATRTYLGLNVGGHLLLNQGGGLLLNQGTGPDPWSDVPPCCVRPCTVGNCQLPPFLSATIQAPGTPFDGLACRLAQSGTETAPCYWVGRYSDPCDRTKISTCELFFASDDTVAIRWGSGGTLLMMGMVSCSPLLIQGSRPPPYQIGLCSPALSVTCIVRVTRAG